MTHWFIETCRIYMYVMNRLLNICNIKAASYFYRTVNGVGLEIWCWSLKALMFELPHAPAHICANEPLPVVDGRCCFVEWSANSWNQSCRWIGRYSTRYHRDNRRTIILVSQNDLNHQLRGWKNRDENSFLQCKTIYHSKIHYQPQNYLSSLYYKNLKVNLGPRRLAKEIIWGCF